MLRKEIGVYVFRCAEHGLSVFLLLSLWVSYDALGKFAGLALEKTVYYPEDRRFLLDLEPRVLHYEVLAYP